MIQYRFALGISLSLLLVSSACGTPDDDEPKGNPVAENCGFEGSAGNEIGIGKYCVESSDCPEVAGGTVIQCSTVLVDNSLPLMCSRLCDLAAADPGCGADTICKNIIELDIDLDVCVPIACQPLFAEPLQ